MVHEEEEGVSMSLSMLLGTPAHPSAARVAEAPHDEPPPPPPPPPIQPQAYEGAVGMMHEHAPWDSNAGPHQQHAGFAPPSAVPPQNGLPQHNPIWHPPGPSSVAMQQGNPPTEPWVPPIPSQPQGGWARPPPGIKPPREWAPPRDPPPAMQQPMGGALPQPPQQAMGHALPQQQQQLAGGAMQQQQPQWHTVPNETTMHQQAGMPLQPPAMPLSQQQLQQQFLQQAPFQNAGPVQESQGQQAWPMQQGLQQPALHGPQSLPNPNAAPAPAAAPAADDSGWIRPAKPSLPLATFPPATQPQPAGQAATSYQVGAGQPPAADQALSSQWVRPGPNLTAGEGPPAKSPRSHLLKPATNSIPGRNDAPVQDRAAPAQAPAQMPSVAAVGDGWIRLSARPNPLTVPMADHGQAEPGRTLPVQSRWQGPPTPEHESRYEGNGWAGAAQDLMLGQHLEAMAWKDVISFPGTGPPAAANKSSGASAPNAKSAPASAHADADGWIRPASRQHAPAKLPAVSLVGTPAGQSAAPGAGDLPVNPAEQEDGWGRPTAVPMTHGSPSQGHAAAQSPSGGAAAEWQQQQQHFMSAAEASADKKSSHVQEFQPHVKQEARSGEMHEAASEHRRATGMGPNGLSRPHLDGSDGWIRRPPRSEPEDTKPHLLQHPNEPVSSVDAGASHLQGSASAPSSSIPIAAVRSGTGRTTSVQRAAATPKGPVSFSFNALGKPAAVADAGVKSTFGAQPEAAASEAQAPSTAQPSQPAAASARSGYTDQLKAAGSGRQPNADTQSRSAAMPQLQIAQQVARWPFTQDQHAMASSGREQATACYAWDWNQDGTPESGMQMQTADAHSGPVNAAAAGMDSQLSNAEGHGTASQMGLAGPAENQAVAAPAANNIPVSFQPGQLESLAAWLQFTVMAQPPSDPSPAATADPTASGPAALGAAASEATAAAAASSFLDSLSSPQQPSKGGPVEGAQASGTTSPMFGQANAGEARGLGISAGPGPPAEPDGDVNMEDEADTDPLARQSGGVQETKSKGALAASGARQHGCNLQPSQNRRMDPPQEVAWGPQVPGSRQQQYPLQSPGSAPTQQPQSVPSMQGPADQQHWAPASAPSGSKSHSYPPWQAQAGVQSQPHPPARPPMPHMHGPQSLPQQHVGASYSHAFGPQSLPHQHAVGSGSPMPGHQSQMPPHQYAASSMPPLPGSQNLPHQQAPGPAPSMHGHPSQQQPAWLSQGSAMGQNSGNGQHHGNGQHGMPSGQGQWEYGHHMPPSAAAPQRYW